MVMTDGKFMMQLRSMIVWVLLSDVNSTFGLCPTYPQVLCLPKCFPPELLPSVKEFRTKGRIPVCCRKHPTSNAVITRCSQPRVSLSHQRGHADELLIANILRANPTSETLYLVDARPKSNAMAKGAGYEREDVYKDTKFKFHFSVFIVFLFVLFERFFFQR